MFGKEPVVMVGVVARNLEHRRHRGQGAVGHVVLLHDDGAGRHLGGSTR